MMIKIGNDWDKLLEDAFKNHCGLWNFLEEQYHYNTVYPADKDNIFNALRATSYERTKVVIVGQDPYYNPDEANGLAFSVQIGTRIPDSLQSIFTEICEDVNCFMPDNGDLLPWAQRGVLLLNTVLTVVHGIPNSHANIKFGSKSKYGWKTFTNGILEVLNEKDAPMVFLLWGEKAKASAIKLNNPKHLVLTAAHPSPLANAKAKERFLGCKHFSKTNKFLKDNGLEPIDWQIPNVE